MEFPEPVISVALECRTKADQEKMRVGLESLAAEDPSFRVSADAETGQTIISGMGELHLEIIVDRLRREFNVEVNVGRPQVAYKQTIRAVVEQEGRFVRQIGGREEYAHVFLRLEPLLPGTGYEFRTSVSGGAVPEKFFPAVDQGVREQMANGINAGLPLVDVRATIFDGSCHDSDSSEIAFKTAASMAVRDGCAKVGAVLLEPIMKVEVVTPQQFTGDIAGDLHRRRGVLQGLDESADGKVIRADVPLAEMFGYATSLRSLSQGRASYAMNFSRYAAVPLQLAAEVVRKS
jgi:elongation factor G